MSAIHRGFAFEEEEEPSPSREAGRGGEKREKPTQTNVSEGGKSCTKKEGAGERKIPRKGKKVGSKAVLLARN